MDIISGQNVPAQSAEPRDAELANTLEQHVHMAAEQATFHRMEAERYERIGRAAAAGLREVQAVTPVAALTVEEFKGSGDGLKISAASSVFPR